MHGLAETMCYSGNQLHSLRIMNLKCGGSPQRAHLQDFNAPITNNRIDNQQRDISAGNLI